MLCRFGLADKSSAPSRRKIFPKTKLSDIVVIARNACDRRLPKTTVFTVVRPTRADLLKATGRTIPDLIAPNLRVWFCGINPGLYSAFVGYHFARPGNRFWPALFAAGFTDRLFAPSEQQELLPRGCGITNLVERATASAAELNSEELIAGVAQLRRKAQVYRPRIIAILGVTAFRAAFGVPECSPGRQPQVLGPADVWVLPNPSGLNARYTPPELARTFRELRIYSESRHYG